MAQFIEEGVDKEPVEITDSVEETQQEEAVQQPVDDLPEKYRGKDIKEIIRMHQEAERLIGRQGSEVGELRKVFDEYIKAQTPKKEQPQSEDIAEDDYYSDPKTAVFKAIENHPKVKQAEMAVNEMNRSKALQTLQSKHPDFGDIVQDPSFQQWVGASKVRSELLIRADKAFDIDAADELFSTWKDRRQAASATVSAEKQARSKSIKSASTAVGSGSDEAPSAKIYRRADIIRMMQTDPDRYDSMQDEIMSAYREGRVR